MGAEQDHLDPWRCRAGTGWRDELGSVGGGDALPPASALKGNSLRYWRLATRGQRSRGPSYGCYRLAIAGGLSSAMRASSYQDIAHERLRCSTQVDALFIGQDLEAATPAD